MEAFKEIKKTCDSFKGLEGLLAKEEYEAIMEQARVLDAEIIKATQIIETVEGFKTSLKQAGYSDAWWDSLLDSGKMEGIVNIDMPKFFDNNFNREKVCMEGFVDTIVRWITVAVEKICKFIAWICDQIHRLVRVFMNFEYEKRVTNAKIKQYRDKAEQILAGEPMQLDKWYDLEQLNGHVEALDKLIHIFIDNEKITQIFTLDNPQINPTGDQARKIFEEKLRTAVYEAGINGDDPEKNGFVIKYNPASRKFIFFLNDLGKKLKTEEKKIDNIQQFDELYNEVINGPISQNIVNISDSLTALERRLKERKDAMQQMVDQLKSSPNADQQQLAVAQVSVAMCEIVLSIQVGAMTYLNNVVSAAWLRDKRLIDAVLDHVKVTTVQKNNQSL